MNMKIIHNFDTETIALFDLTLLGQETYLFIGKIGYLLIPFHKLGHYDENKGMMHNYNLGYLIFEKMGGFSVKLLPHKGKIIDYQSEISYQMQIEQPQKLKNILFEDIGLRPTGLVSFSIDIQYQHLHLAYNFTSPDCSPTHYFDISNDQSIRNFLLTQNLENLRELVNEISKTR
jgi:hypothetical protein